MLNKIIHFSLKNQFLIVLASVILLVGGLFIASNMDVDVFPDLTAPTVVVMTDAHGMASEEVERLVTFPIESAVNGATDVRRVRSVSSHGFSFVWVEFDWGADIFKARQVVSEKLMTVSSQMPLGVGQPVLAPQSSVMGEIFFVGLQADSTSLMELRTLAEWEVKPLILATGGVSQVTIIGGEYKQYQVLADPQKMIYYEVSMDDLVNACQSVGVNSAGGVLRAYGNEYVVRGIARTSNLEELAGTYLKTINEYPVRLGDVAELRIGSAPRMGHASGNAAPAIILSVSKQPNANTVEVTKRLEDNLLELQKSLPPDVNMNLHIFRQADFIERSVRNVRNALIEGGIFVIIILLLFLGSFRTTIISLLAIPLSLLGAVAVLNALGMTINTMSLGGMAIAIGSLVDDAIIDVENVHKRLRQNNLLPQPQRKRVFKVVFDASVEIRASILNATLIIMVSFLPLFFLSGMEGRMLQPLGIAFLVSLFVSLIVAMTLTPVLSMLMLSAPSYLNRNQKDKWLSHFLSVRYQKMLTWALNHQKLLLYSTAGVFLICLVVFSTLGRSFLPEFNEGALTISVVTQPGTSLEEVNRLGNMVEKELLAIPEIQSTARRTGRGELDEHSQASHSSEVDVNFELNSRDRHEFMAEVREVLDVIPGISYSVGQPLGHRIDHMLSGTRANIAIKLFGNDLNRLYASGNDIKNAIDDIEGLVDLNVEQQVEIPQIHIRPNRTMLAQYGISTGRFNDFVNIAIAGEQMADIYEEQKRFDLILRLNRDYTHSFEGLHAALLDAGNGLKVPLEQVAEIKSSTGPSSISRENVQRRIIISGNVEGRDLRSVVEAIRDRIDESIIIPEGYRIEYGGQFENEARASRTLLFASIIAVIVIYFLLYLEFKNFILAGIILINLPLALIGGVLTVRLTSGILSIPSIIGFITLFGIATRNGILLVSNYQRLLQEKNSIHHIIIMGSVDRLNAILMTALTAAFALIPLALQGELPGNEIQSPMAQVILGGLLTSTLLNIIIVPVVYSLFYEGGIIKKDNIGFDQGHRDL